MSNLPNTVSTYYHDYAPKGYLIAYWLDQRREYNILVLYQRDDKCRFSVGAFPEVVGHWGHQLTGGDYSLEEIKGQLDYGFWEADEPTIDRIRALIGHLESGLNMDRMLADYRELCDPYDVFKAFKHLTPRRGPRLTNDGQYRTVSVLVQALADANTAIAAEAAQKLVSMGITENDGPLFARNALLMFRKKARK